MLLLVLLACLSSADTADTAIPTDTGCAEVRWAIDMDRDGWGDADPAHPESVQWACVGWTVPGYSIRDGDCDDADAAVNPGTYDPANDGVDRDCDGVD